MSSGSFKNVTNKFYTYVAEMAEWLDTISCIKLGGFRSHVEASCVSNHTEDLGYNETVSVDDNIYIYIYIYDSALNYPQGLICHQTKPSRK